MVKKLSTKQKLKKLAKFQEALQKKFPGDIPKQARMFNVKVKELNITFK